MSKIINNKNRMEQQIIKWLEIIYGDSEIKEVRKNKDDLVKFITDLGFSLIYFDSMKAKQFQISQNFLPELFLEV